MSSSSSPPSSSSSSNSPPPSSGHVITATMVTTPPNSISGSSTANNNKQKRKRKTKPNPNPSYVLAEERSKEFNLTLDINNLRQEISNLVSLRTILESRTMLSKNTPTGSLVQTAKEYYRLYNRGYNFKCRDPLRSSYRSGSDIVSAIEQENYLFTVCDEHVDCGNELFGIPVLLEQTKRYALCFRTRYLHLAGVDAFDTEDSTVVKTKGKFGLQIQRFAMVMLFPHVLSREDIVSRLVGQEAEADFSMDFYYNDDNKLGKVVVEFDLVRLLLQLVPNPSDVAVIMDQAIIGENAMLGVPRYHEAEAEVE